MPLITLQSSQAGSGHRRVSARRTSTGPQSRRLDCLGRSQTSEKPFNGGGDGDKFRTPFQSLGITGRGSSEGRIDKEMGVWNRNSVYSLATLSPAETTSETPTPTSCSTYITTHSISNQIHIHRCDFIIMPVNFSTTTSPIIYSPSIGMPSSPPTSTF